AASARSSATASQTAPTAAFTTSAATTSTLSQSLPPPKTISSLCARRLNVVRMLMRGGKVDEPVDASSSSSTSTTASALSESFPKPYALPSPPATAPHFSPSPQPQQGYVFPPHPTPSSTTSSDSSSSAFLAPPLTFDLAVRRHSDPSPSASTTMETSGFRLPASLSANFVASRGSSSANVPSFSAASNTEQAYPSYLDPTLFLPA
ncbi:hypothetical protein JCM8547_000677, partial [Rhodosporidiobolus lusitaniae]